MSALRSTLSTLLILAGLVVSAVAVPATWMKTHLLDTEQWTAAVAPLIAEEPVQRAVSGALVSAVDSENRLPAWAGALLLKVTDKVVGTEPFARVWRSAVELSHVQLLEGIRGEGTGLDLSGEVIAVDLAPLFEALVPRLTDAGVPGLDALPAPEGRVVLEGTEATAEALGAAGVLDRLAWPLAAMAAGLMLLGVLTSRAPARSLALAGMGMFVVAAVEGAGWRLVMSERERWSSGTTGAVLLDALGTSVGPWLLWAGAFGVAVLCVGGVLMLLSGRRQ